MLKLGKVVNVERVSEATELYHFDINLMEWSHMPVKALFRIEKEPIGNGGFWKAFKATTSERELSDTLWVIKKYLPEAEQIIKATNQTLEQHTRKVVQMHTLARTFAKRLEQGSKRAGNLELYGQTLKYKKIFFGKKVVGLLHVRETSQSTSITMDFSVSLFQIFRKKQRAWHIFYMSVQVMNSYC